MDVWIRQILVWEKCGCFFWNLKRKLLNNKTAQAFLEHNRKSALEKKDHFFFFQTTTCPDWDAVPLQWRLGTLSPRGEPNRPQGQYIGTLQARSTLSQSTPEPFPSGSERSFLNSCLDQPSLLFPTPFLQPQSKMTKPNQPEKHPPQTQPSPPPTLPQLLLTLCEFRELFSVLSFPLRDI